MTSPSMQISNKSRTYTKKQLYLVVFFAFLGTLFDGVELNLISYPMVFIAKGLAVTTTQIVAVMTFQGLSSLVGGFLFGWLGDKIGRRWSYALCVFIYGLGTFLAGFSQSYDVFMATRVFAGLGIGGLFGLAFTMFSECWKTERRGFMGGLIQSMFVLGQILTVVVTYLTIASLGEQQGWRQSFIILGIMSILIAVAALFFLPESILWKEYGDNLRAGTLPKELRRSSIPFVDLFKHGLASGTILFMIISTAVFIASYSVITFQMTFLLKEAHVSLNIASIIVLIGLVITGIAYALIGYISDIISRKWAFFVGAIVATIGFGSFLLLVSMGHTSISENYLTSIMFWSLMLCNAGYAGFAVLGIWMSEYYPTRFRATGTNACYYMGRGLGAGVYPLFALKLSGSVTMAFGLGVVGAIGCLLVAPFTPDKTGREIKAIE